MGYYQKKATQKVPATVENVWDFISSPRNLKEITPDYMGFDILTNDIPEKMYEGMIIGYIVTPVFGIKTKWLTEITKVRELQYFVDEQRLGPYKMWHHQHHLEPIDGGVLMSDTITYIPPFGILGDLANSIMIKGKLKEIFEYRTIAVEKRFGKY